MVLWGGPFIFPDVQFFFCMDKFEEFALLPKLQRTFS